MLRLIVLTTLTLGACSGKNLNPADGGMIDVPSFLIPDTQPSFLVNSQASSDLAPPKPHLGDVPLADRSPLPDAWVADVSMHPRGFPDGGVKISFEPPALGEWGTGTGKQAGWSNRLMGSSMVFAQGTLDVSGWQIAFTDQSFEPYQLIEVRLRVIDFVASTSSNMVMLLGRYDPEVDRGVGVAIRGDGTVVLRQREYGKTSSLGLGHTVQIFPGRWFTLRLEMVDGTVVAYIDGNLVYAALDPGIIDGPGSVALGSIGATFEVERVSVMARPSMLQ